MELSSRTDSVVYFHSNAFLSVLRRLSILLHSRETCVDYHFSLTLVADFSFQTIRTHRAKDYVYLIASQWREFKMSACLQLCRKTSSVAELLTSVFQLISLFPYSEEKQPKNETEPFKEPDSVDTERTLFLSKEEYR